jgi:hypothetical protein
VTSVFYPISFGRKRMNECIPTDLNFYVLEVKAARMILPEQG